MMPEARFAARSARTIALKSAAASTFGSDSTNDRTEASGADGRAKSSTRALLLRDFSGYVWIPERSNSSYGKFIARFFYHEDHDEHENHEVGLTRPTSRRHNCRTGI